ncbi:PREDICTED: uncharacterized protein LOC105451331 [Wasmannia auropunctata]|uniref:uncharacterized protein LOC105451331 n=1 Tax=Wasmannia auropunctata TaxID=64793 RepID=UPI0005EE3ADB|nr:PREDICTED: uncharacterized protein LOC105451331 [Wasmannia auropunctata]
MSNANPFLSKRQFRRVIENETNIDLAGSSKHILKHNLLTTNISFKDSNLDYDLHKNSNENINISIEDNINDSVCTEIASFFENCQQHPNNNNDIQRNYDYADDNDNNDNEDDDHDFPAIEIINEAHNDAINDEKKIKNAIATWAVTYNVNHVTCNALLKILRQYTPYKFSADIRTLLQTPRQAYVTNICGGEFFYSGLENIIIKMFLKSCEKHINLLINIDGLPLSKSSNASLWPILCSNTTNNDVYLVGAFFGDKKPQDSNTFLQPLINDLINLRNGYVYKNNVIEIKLFGLICDAPAKSFVLNVKGHTGFSNGIQYRRIWTKIRSNDFWQRIVGEHFTPTEWLATFRMSKETFITLCDIIRGDLEPKPLFLKSREPLSVEKQVAIAIYKLASCAEYRIVGDVMGVHKSTVRKCLFRVTRAINDIMTKNIIFMPSEDEAKFISLQFEKKTFIPQLFGCIDGTHIPITPPHEGYRDFVNRKGWPSYNVMAVVDHNGRFRNIVIKHSGSVNDAVVFKESSIYKNAQTIIPQTSKVIDGMDIPYMIVGDPTYPMLPWLIKDYSGTLSAEEESFNVYLNSARVSVEMAFGRLKARWRILCKKMDCAYTFSPQIILACCTLHNFVESHKERFYTEWLEEVSNNDQAFPQPRIVQNRDRNCMLGITVRDHLKQYLAANYPLRKSLIQ